MAYFDSPKNRALWNKELAGLKEEKKLRRSGLSPQVKPDMKKQEEAARANTPYRIRTSFQELMKEENESLRKLRPERSRSMERSQSMKKDTEVHKKSPEVTR